MKSRPYSPYDYVTVSSWYVSRGIQAIPPQLLPQTGLLIYEGDTPLACAFLYKTDSSLALIDGLITNPNATDSLSRKEAMRLLLEELSTIAKEAGYSVLMAAPTHPNVGPFLESQGFTRDPAPTPIFVRSLIG